MVGAHLNVKHYVDTIFPYQSEVGYQIIITCAGKLYLAAAIIIGLQLQMYNRLTVTFGFYTVTVKITN